MHECILTNLRDSVVLDLPKKTKEKRISGFGDAKIGTHLVSGRSLS